jgi:hypothetical protein
MIILQNKFYNRLNDVFCSNTDYNQAQNVWNTFDCKSLLDYHNIYLKSGVFLLTDTRENIREVCLKNYKLDCETKILLAFEPKYILFLDIF